MPALRPSLAEPDAQLPARGPAAPHPDRLTPAVPRRLEVPDPRETSARGRPFARCCPCPSHLHHSLFRDLRFTPHDFRRIFITELVNSGLPIHIGAALLGHLNVQTTRGYVAVFDEDVVRHYQAHIHQRRQDRPAGEYRDTTKQEWDEFEEHFDHRKVELGACGRPYGTPCQHEHACLSELAQHGDEVASAPTAVTESSCGEVGGSALTGVLRASEDRQHLPVAPVLLPGGCSRRGR
ncbi:tyrosine-type recombinase/integrase [Streptomyces cyaneofuscatus]|uniref:site-specific integrase n=1 Tax=Streptomyces cyaneofuscatus TaxID=66883 RepID=UPI0037FD85C9